MNKNEKYNLNNVNLHYSVVTRVDEVEYYVCKGEEENLCKRMTSGLQMRVESLKVIIAAT